MIVCRGPLAVVRACRFRLSRRELGVDAASQPQEGIAAIELSLTLIALLIIIFAIVGYGALFWVKQSMSTVAADAARHALLMSYATPSADVATEAAKYACGTAQQIAVLRAFSDLQPQDNCGSFAVVELPAASCSAAGVALAATYRCLTVTLKLTVVHWPLMNTMYQFAAALTPDPQDWVPVNLSTTATVLVAPASANP